MRKPAPIRVSKKTHGKLIVLLLVLLAVAVPVSRHAALPGGRPVVERRSRTVPAPVSVPAGDRSEAAPLSGGETPGGPAEKSGAVPDGLELPACGSGEFVVRNPAGRYTLLYDTAYRQARWVAYVLTRREVRTRGTERRNAFRSDPEVVARGWPTAVDRDYAGSGFDRGHLLPSADRNDCAAENGATFLLSNVSPQYPKLNRNQWRLLEEQVRRWADRYDSLYIVTGSELRPGLRRIRGRVGVPEYYFKALLTCDGGRWHAVAFRIPNVHEPEGCYADYALSVDRLEELTGLDFFPALADSIEDRVESCVEAAFWR